MGCSLEAESFVACDWFSSFDAQQMLIGLFFFGAQKSPQVSDLQAFLELVGRRGLEPRTKRLKVSCSTD